MAANRATSPPPTALFLRCILGASEPIVLVRGVHPVEMTRGATHLKLARHKRTAAKHAVNLPVILGDHRIAGIGLIPVLHPFVGVSRHVHAFAGRGAVEQLSDTHGAGFAQSADIGPVGRPIRAPGILTAVRAARRPFPFRLRGQALARHLRVLDGLGPRDPDGREILLAFVKFMVGYRVGNTLSESGAVSRGVCVVDENQLLMNVVERTHIEEKGGIIIYLDEKGEEVSLESKTPVSMNMWGFTPDYFDYSLEYFKDFLNENGQKLKSEFYIPLAVNNLIVEKKVTCKVLDTPSKWFGVTYAEDRPQVVLKINELVRKGVYPERLYK